MFSAGLRLPADLRRSPHGLPTVLSQQDSTKRVEIGLEPIDPSPLPRSIAGREFYGEFPILIDDLQICRPNRDMSTNRDIRRWMAPGSGLLTWSACPVGSFMV
jgi:hypothetical protein